MIKLQIEGQSHQVHAFLYELQQRPQIECTREEMISNSKNEIQVICSIKHQPSKRFQVVQIVTADNVKIHIPMLDMIQAEIEEGVKVFSGKVFDVFA